MHLLLSLGAGTALDPPGLRAVDVVVGDPALIVVLLGTGGASRLGAREGLDLDLLDLLDGLDGAGLGEKGLDPGLVDEVEGRAEETGEEEVEEDAGKG
jgi:hypothetical protein